MTEPEEGDVWTVWFDAGVGHEQAGVRPALVISTGESNAMPHGLRIVVPITSRDRGIPNHVALNPPEGGLTLASVLMCEQVSAQSLLRFRRKRGVVSEETLSRVRMLIGLFVGTT